MKRYLAEGWEALEEAPQRPARPHLVDAVPAGIIASGFVNEIEAQQAAKKREQQVGQLQSAFVEHPVKVLGCGVRRGALNTVNIGVSLGITEGDLFELAEETPGFRLRPKASAPGTAQPDMIVVEHFDQTTDYGHLEDRGSNIWIVSPASCGQQSIGWFTATLARALGANYLSNELYGDVIYKMDETFGNSGLVQDRSCVFKSHAAYLSDDVEVPEAFQTWKRDILAHIGADHTVIVVRASGARNQATFMLQNGGPRGSVEVEREHSTVDDPDKLQALVNGLNDLTMEAYGKPTTTHNTIGSTKKEGIIHFIRDQTAADTILLFIDVEQITHGRTVAVIAMLRDALGDWAQA
jgi:hypothetical protein